MARRFTCLFRDSKGFGELRSHDWTTKSSPLAPAYGVVKCPDHDGLPNNDGPVQSKEA